MHVDNAITIETWKKFREGFLMLNYHIKPEDVVDLQVCELSSSDEGFMLPSKRKIVLCANKIKSQDHFNKVLTYQVLHQGYLQIELS